MPESDRSRQRGEVIERSMDIEWLMNAIISQHYFGQVRLPFVIEVLCDENCSFGMKRSVIDKIVKDFDGQRMQDLYRLCYIRNQFAHVHEKFVPGSESPPTDAIAVDSRRVKRWNGSAEGLQTAAISFDALYEEFMRIAGPLVDYLLGVHEGLGGVVR